MSPDITVQRATAAAGVPSDDRLIEAATAALAGRPDAGELCLRVVDETESAALNARYRDKQGPTNVLSFPCDIDLPDSPVLGDLVLCAPVIAREAAEQGKPRLAHWRHMVVHGVLHLLGHDHIGETEAEAMEAAERNILKTFGVPDPYQAHDPDQNPLHPNA